MWLEWETGEEYLRVFGPESGHWAPFGEGQYSWGQRGVSRHFPRLRGDHAGTQVKTVAHCATPFLTETGSWIYNQIRPLERYRPIVLTQEARNLDIYPVPSLFTAEDYRAPQRLANHLARRLTGEYPFYAGILRREGASLIHAHFGYQGCRCLRAKRRVGIPMVTTFYGADAGSFPRHRTWRRRYRELFDRGELFLAEGTAMAARLEGLGCPPERIRVHHLGVDVSRIPFQQRLPADPVRVMMCGHFREKKGFPGGIRALGRAAVAARVACELVVIGDGPDRPQVLTAIAAAGLGGSTRLLGLQPYGRVVEEMGRCHLLLQPSRTAADGDTEGGAPVILLDAQASGLPVVATTHADIPEYVVDGESGLLAPEGDEDALTECLVHLLTHPEEWAPMGICGRRHVERQYGARTQCRALEDLYDSLV